MLIASLRSSVGLVGVFFFLTITFLLLAIAEFVSTPGVGVAGGAFGIITAFVRPPSRFLHSADSLSERLVRAIVASRSRTDLLLTRAGTLPLLDSLRPTAPTLSCRLVRIP